MRIKYLFILIYLPVLFAESEYLVFVRTWVISMAIGPKCLIGLDQNPLNNSYLKGKIYLLGIDNTFLKLINE